MARVKKESGTTQAPEIAAPPPEETPPEKTGPTPADAKDVIGASADLIATLEEADKEAAKATARAIVFDSANAALETPLDPRFVAIVEKTFAPIDWSAAFSELDSWMELGDRRTEEAFIRKAREQGPAIVRTLYACDLQIRLARESWEKDNDVVLGTIRAEATKALQAEKDRGARNKTITEADIIGQCARMFPDEWPRQEQTRLKYKLTEDKAKHEVEVATLRCRHLDTMMNRLRGS